MKRLGIAFIVTFLSLTLIPLTYAQAQNSKLSQLKVNNANATIKARLNVNQINPQNPATKGALNEGFESWPPSGWTIIQGPDYPTNKIEQTNEDMHNGSYSLRFSSVDEASGYDEYIITPLLDVQSANESFSFYYRTEWEDEVFRIGWSTTGKELSDFTWDSEVSVSSYDWAQYVKNDLPIGTRYVAIHYYSNHKRYLYIDDVTGPNLATGIQPGELSNPSPADGATEVEYASGTLTWDFGQNSTHYDLWFGPTGNMSKVVDWHEITGSSGSYTYTNINYKTTYQWRVVTYNNNSGEMRYGPIWSFTTKLKDGMKQIGYGTVTNAHLPIEPNAGYSYSQTLYLASDFGTVESNKQITRIYFNYTKGSANNHNADLWTIYMGTTSATSLNDWIPVSSLMQVFDGNTGFGYKDAGDGWLEIILGTPFSYNPSTDGNLILAIDENSAGVTSDDDDFYCDENTSTPHVSIYYNSNDTNPDPSSPPFGTLSSYYPDVRFQFEDVQQHFYVNPESKDFGTVYLNEHSNYQTFTVSNSGQGTLVITGTSITGSNPDDFNLVDHNNYPVQLTGSQTMTVEVRFSPTAAGSRSATLRFTANAKTYHDVSLSGTGYDATVTTYPYNENYSSFTESTDATGFADNWTTSPSNTSTEFRWNVGKGSTPTASTGPAIDHTGDPSGLYLYTEASDGNQSAIAYVYAPPFNLSSLTNPAAEFYYYMYGADMGTLEFQVSDDGGDNWTTLITLSGQQQENSFSDWEFVYIDLSSYSGKTVIFRFKAIKGDGEAGDMAIDDFYVGEKIDKTLSSITVEQASTSNVYISSTNNEILRIRFAVDGGAGTLPLNSITVTSANDDDDDIANNGVKLYVTSKPTFSTNNLLASGSLTSGSVTFNGLNYDLPSGFTYLWITYDVSSSATPGHVIDAKILANGIDVNGSTYNSSEENPSGSREIIGVIFNSVTVTQASTYDVEMGSSDNEILKIAFDVYTSTSSGGAPIQFTSLTVNGSNTNDNDVTAVKIYKTSSETFSADNLVANGTFAKGQLTFNLSENLTSDMYYWVAYDISSTAEEGNEVDALIPANGMTVNGNTYNSSDDNPSGSRTIRNFNHGGNGTLYGGYYFANSTPNGGSNRPTYSWIDPVSGGHTQITSWKYDSQTAGDADEGYFEASIGFSFPFFDNSYTQCYIGTNGLITFSDGYPLSGGSDVSIPSTDQPNNMIAVSYMDLDDMSDGKVYYGSDADGNFVVTWYHYHERGDDNEWITCQAILKPNGDIKLQYNYDESQFYPAVNFTTILGETLIGIENSDGTVGHQYRNNGVGGPIYDNSSKTGSLAIEYSKNEGATPVEISFFTATPNDEGVVEIEWTTQTEINTAQFEVERAEITNDENAETQWQTIGSVQAAGNSNSPKKYSFRDELEHSGNYKYRLKIVDVDGSYKYGNEVEITAEIALKYELSQNYPNPFNPTTTIKFSIKKEGNVRLEVFNALGQRVAELLNKKMKAGKYKVKFNASNFASGVYFYRIESGNYRAVKKMLLMK